MKPWHVKDEDKPDNDAAENAAVDKMHHRELIEKRRRMSTVLCFLDVFGPLDFEAIMATHTKRPAVEDLEATLQALLDRECIELENGTYRYIKDTLRDTAAPAKPRAEIDPEARPNKRNETFGT